jgi:hypothetical protein
MFGWFKKKPEPKAAERTAEAIQHVMTDYASLVERYPGAVIDASKLPLPKASMKLILKTAWLNAGSEQERDWLEAGYTILGCFQDGVGDNPIFTLLPPNVHPAGVIVSLESYRLFSDKIAKDMQTLSTECADFTEGDTLP